MPEYQKTAEGDWIRKRNWSTVRAQLEELRRNGADCRAFKVRTNVEEGDEARADAHPETCAVFRPAVDTPQSPTRHAPAGESTTLAPEPHAAQHPRGRLGLDAVGNDIDGTDAQADYRETSDPPPVADLAGQDPMRHESRDTWTSNDDAGIYVDASDWYSDPELSVCYSKPEFDEKEAAQLVKAWILKQGRSWPMALDALTLTERSRLVHVAYLLLIAQVSFEWAATASETRTRTGSRRETRSRSLGTDAQGVPQFDHYTVDVPTTETYIVHYPVSGTVNDIGISLTIPDTEAHSTQGGPPDFERATETAKRMSEVDRGRLPLLQPRYQTAADIDGVLHDHVVAHLDSQGPNMVDRAGPLTKFTVTRLEILTKTSWVHLYPVILSVYEYRGKEYGVRIDGHTRRVHVDVPWAVRFNRRLRDVAAVGGILTMFVGAWWMSAQDDGAGGVGVEVHRDEADEIVGTQRRSALQIEQSIGLDGPMRRRIQLGLSAAGFDAGPADGQFGPRTRRAIEAWQAAQEQPASGYLSAFEAEELARSPEGSPMAATGGGVATDEPPEARSSAQAEQLGSSPETGATAATGTGGAREEPPKTTAATPAEQLGSSPGTGATAATGTGDATDEPPEATTPTGPGEEVAAPAEPSPVDEPVRVGGNVARPRKTRNVPPEYPRLARLQRIQGDVILQVTVDRQGAVSNVSVLRSPEGLEEAAIIAVRQWRYEPTSVNGRPVSVIFSETVRFRM